MTSFARSRSSVVLFGDSITQQSFSAGGWGGLLSDHYVRRADVLNRGYSGYNVRWAKQIVDDLFPVGPAAPKPSLVTIFFGANDASSGDPPHNSRQHVPVAEYAETLEQMVRHIRRSAGDDTAIVVITPPPGDEL